MENLLWPTAAYFVGGIPFGFIIGKMRGVDVRTVGSKNIGATNVFRTVGKKWGLLAFLCDFLKGLLPTLAVKHFGDSSEWLPVATGIACVVGHMLTPYMKFKGGKGVATAFGALIALMPATVGIAFAIFALTFACSNYISLGSCAAATSLAVMVWIPFLDHAGYRDLPLCVLMTLIAAFIVWKHRSNIGRLVRGEENKIYLFKKGSGNRVQETGTK
jgi:glycerol-3-phosphate acyltransferase PlsY